jgi:hypothetical protein
MFGLRQGAGESGTDVRIGFRSGWVRYVNVVFGGVGVAAVLLVVGRVLESDPKQAFALLQAWGPNFFIAMVVVMILGAQLERMVEIQREGARAQHQMAEAMSAIAQKDDRQLQEIQTLSSYTAQQMDRIHRRQMRTEATLDSIARKLKIETVSSGEDHVH